MKVLKKLLSILIIAQCLVLAACQEFEKQTGLSGLPLAEAPVNLSNGTILLEMVLDGEVEKTPIIVSDVPLEIRDIAPTNLVLTPLRYTSAAYVSEVETWIETDSIIRGSTRGPSLPSDFFLSCTSQGNRAHIRCAGYGEAAASINGTVAKVIVEKPYSRMIAEDLSFSIGPDNSVPYRVTLTISEPTIMSIFSFSIEVDPSLEMLSVELGDAFKEACSIKTIRSAITGTIDVTIESVAIPNTIMAAPPVDLITGLSQEFPLVNFSPQEGKLHLAKGEVSWTIIVPQEPEEQTGLRMSKWGQIKRKK